MTRSDIISSKPLRVRGASHARVTFNTAAPHGAELIVEHLRAKRLLARERRHLAANVRHVDIKTHPRASHLECSLRADNLPINGVQFNVDCGEPIEPTARHFIVIGAMKAGTTSLFELMAQHPALCRTWAELPGVSFPKEINYFRKLYRENHSALHYDWRFPFDPARHAWTLDVSPGYAKWPGSKAVPRRIASLGGEVRLVYILRDPVDRIESHIAHTIAGGSLPRNLNHYVRISSYALQLDKFMEYFARDDVLLLDFEQLRKNPAAILAQVCDFLSIDRFAGTHEVHNTRRVDFRLNAQQRAELTEAVRPDVQRLARDYGFRPAERWLRKPTLRWPSLSAIRT